MTSKIITLFFVFIISFEKNIFSQNVGINSTGAAPDASSMLDVSSSNKGMLMPRLTTAQRNAIVSPVHSLMIFNTTTDCFESYNANTSTWVSVGCIGCLAPGSFSASAATSITCISFSANWSVSSGATTYFLDVATDAGFTIFVAGYNNLSVGNVLTYAVTGLSGNTTYYYRIRSGNSCGTSPNTGTITVTTSVPTPASPTANAASSIAQTSFVANWTASSGTTTYFLDVATDAGFTIFVSGYNNLNVGNITSYTVSGLTGNTTYYYRVRASNSCGTSSNSNTITVTTTSCYVPGSQTFSYTGALQSWTVPCGVTSITVDVQGAAGGGNTGTDCNAVQFAGGAGGRVQGIFSIIPGDILYIYVGGKGTDNFSNPGGVVNGGWNGGANGYDDASYTYYGGSGGGGGSDIRRNGTTLTDRIFVAGGGGGSGNDGCVCTPHSLAGGAGGGLSAGAGQPGAGCTGSISGQGGTQAGGGAGASGGWGAGSAGSLGLGGASYQATTYGGAGGGGGYYGGGGGAMGGGGGGSNYANPAATSVVHTSGFQAGNGQISISW